MSEMTPAERFAAAKVRSKYSKVASFAAKFPFELDDFQVAGCRSLEDGKGVLVAAPTGAGKTIVGEFAAYLAIEQGKKCFYTAPIKALSNQKYQDLKEMYGENRVGLLTGDTSINSEAPLVVMTTEVLRNMIYSNSHTLKDLGFVVMDEVHYLADNLGERSGRKSSSICLRRFRLHHSLRPFLTPKNLVIGSTKFAGIPRLLLVRSGQSRSINTFSSGINCSIYFFPRER